MIFIPIFKPIILLSIPKITHPEERETTYKPPVSKSQIPYPTLPSQLFPSEAKAAGYKSEVLLHRTPHSKKEKEKEKEIYQEQIKCPFDMSYSI